ncbi:hypothetical protein Ddc_21183 [Ditylenchus destructor]|nr:hypothetical protein Ddc_21183 [Ditylenchus destructor]
MDLPSQSSLSRKRQLPDNVSDNDSLESRENRRLVMNDEQLESGGNQCSHDVMNAGIVILSDQAKEVELNKMIDQCHRFPIQQISSNDSLSELRQALNLLNGAETLAGNGNIEQNGPALTKNIQESDNDDDIIIIEDVNETTAMSNNSSDGNLLEQPTQEQAERIAEIEPNKPNEHLTANPIVDSENNDVPNTVLPKRKHSVNISMERNEPNEHSTANPINVSKNNDAHSSVLPKTGPFVNIAVIIEKEQEFDNDEDVIMTENVNETTAMSNHSSDSNLSEQPTQEQVEPIPEMEPNEPNEHSTANLIIDFENNEVPNTVLPKSEPSVNISAAPIETNEPNEQTVTCPITENTPNWENNEAPDSINHNVSTASVGLLLCIIFLPRKVTRSEVGLFSWAMNF